VHHHHHLPYLGIYPQLEDLFVLRGQFEVVKWFNKDEKVAVGFLFLTLLLLIRTFI